MTSPETVKTELKQTLTNLTSRGLLHAAQWTSECLISLIDVKIEPLSPPSTYSQSDFFLLAKNYFDLREYHRAAFLLQDEEDLLAVFLKCYAIFLSGEKEKVENEASENSPNVNKELPRIYDELSSLYKAKRIDGFCLYLYGVILREMKRKDKARKVFAMSLQLVPCNWACWLDLASICDDLMIVEELDLPDHWMKMFFNAYLYSEMQMNKECLDEYDKLAEIFPNNTYILAQTAKAYYNDQDFTTAEVLFEDLLVLDPYRITDMDFYSNILYVNENRAKLSFLAYKVSKTDKYTPEACAVIGNYYSLRGEHEKAITYFQRALDLNPKYLAALTLMGHEYVEIRDTTSAFSAYRKAVDINPRDYRAWYGLGQTYEILRMPLYALYYFRKACNLRPYDARMWCAMGECYDLVGNTHEAIKCYERALSNQDREGVALQKLAKLYESQNDEVAAAFYYKKNLEQRDLEGLDGFDTQQALLFLATYTTQNCDFSEAEKYCTRLLDYPGKCKEEAKALLRQIHSSNSPHEDSLHVITDSPSIPFYRANRLDFEEVSTDYDSDISLED